jgi:dienelactone hydrolase
MRIASGLPALLICLLPAGAQVPPANPAAPAAPAIAEYLAVEGPTVKEPSQLDLQFLGVMSRQMFVQSRLNKTVNPDLETLSRSIQQAYRAKQFMPAFRLLTRYVALAQGKPPGEWLDVAGALQMDVERRVFPAGAIVHVTLQPLFKPKNKLSGAYTAVMSLEDVKGTVVSPPKKRPFEDLEVMEFSLPVPASQPGTYVVHYTLLDPSGKEIASATKKISIEKDYRARLQPMRERFLKLRIAGTAELGPRQAIAMSTIDLMLFSHESLAATYLADLWSLLHPVVQTLYGPPKDPYWTDTVAIDLELNWTEQILKALEQKQDPFPTRGAELRLGFVAPGGDPKIPYRLYVPPQYDPAKPSPLVIALHDATGDDGSYLERVKDPNGVSVLERLAREKGWLVLAPNAYGPFGYYQGPSSQSVLQTLDEVVKGWSVDPKAIYLTGHGAGGAGVFEVAALAPTRFAALAVVEPEFVRAPAFDKLPDVPMILYTGARDSLTSPQDKENLKLSLRARFKRAAALDVPDSDRRTIVVSSMPGIFEFFETGSKLPAPASPR